MCGQECQMYSKKQVYSACSISGANRIVKFMFCMLKTMKVLYKLIVLFLMGLARHTQNTRVNIVITFWHLKKEVKNEVRDLNALAGSNATLTIYYTFHVLPPFTFFLSQYGIHTKLFLHLINSVFKISSTLF